MKRTDIIKLLVKEGLSEKTLANFSDKQIFDLSKRMLGEDVMISKKDPQFRQKVANAQKTNKTIETYEELKGGQKKLDVNKNNKLDSEDFKMLRKSKTKTEPKEDSWDSKYVQKAFKKVSASQKRPKHSGGYDMFGFESDKYHGKIPKSSDKVYDELHRSVYNPETGELELPKEIDEIKKIPSSGLSKEKKSEVVKKAKKGEDIGKPGKGFEKIEKKAKESGAKNPKAVAAAAMWKNIKRESVVKESEKTEVSNWVDGLVESNYHPFTSKGEILNLIKEKLNSK